MEFKEEIRHCWNVWRTIENLKNVCRKLRVCPEYASEMLSQIDPSEKRSGSYWSQHGHGSFFVPADGEFRVRRRRYLRRNRGDMESEGTWQQIGHSDAASIENGLKRSFCYITTAVCKSLNKPDDCYELNLLREYRDQYLDGDKGWRDSCKEYYNIAPTIVKTDWPQSGRIRNLCGYLGKVFKAVCTPDWSGRTRRMQRIVHKDGSFSGEEIFVFSRRREGWKRIVEDIHSIKDITKRPSDGGHLKLNM